MPKPRLLDLFCGAGGAAMGFHRAGFDVVGVDLEPQPRYPFEFWQMDALDLLRNGFESTLFDAIHASPPCQFHTDMQAVAKNQAAHEDMIGPTRELLEQTGLPYVIENVPGARKMMREPFQLCGSSFGLGTWPDIGCDAFTDFRSLHRHRLFETNWPIGLVPACGHTAKTVGIYGDHLRFNRRSAGGQQLSGSRALSYGSRAMGIDWMTWPELKEAIPPAYTEFIGAQLLAHIRQEVAA